MQRTLYFKYCQFDAIALNSHEKPLVAISNQIIEALTKIAA